MGTDRFTKNPFFQVIRFAHLFGNAQDSGSDLEFNPIPRRQPLVLDLNANNLSRERTRNGKKDDRDEYVHYSAPFWLVLMNVGCCGS